MEVGNEISLKIRTAIKAKLLELGIFIGEEELPDYIMVMVANKKSQEQMTEDLCLFLGDSTEIFTSWLHDLLARLQSVASVPVSVVVKPLSSADECQSSQSSVSIAESESNSVLTHAPRKTSKIKHASHSSSSSSQFPNKKTKTPVRTKNADSGGTTKCVQRVKSVSHADTPVKVRLKPAPSHRKKPSDNSCASTASTSNDSVSGSCLVNTTGSKEDSPKKVTVVKTKVKCAADSQGIVKEGITGNSASSDSKSTVKGAAKDLKQGVVSNSKLVVKDGVTKVKARDVRDQVEKVTAKKVRQKDAPSPAPKSKEIVKDNVGYSAATSVPDSSAEGTHKDKPQPGNAPLDSRQTVKVKTKPKPSPDHAVFSNKLVKSEGASTLSSVLSTASRKQNASKSPATMSDTSDVHIPPTGGAKPKPTVKLKTPSAVKNENSEKSSQKRKNSDPDPGVTPNKIVKQSVVKKKVIAPSDKSKQNISSTKVSHSSQKMSKLNTVSKTRVRHVSDARASQKTSVIGKDPSQHSKKTVSRAEKLDNKSAKDLKKSEKMVIQVTANKRKEQTDPAEPQEQVRRIIKLKRL